MTTDQKIPGGKAGDRRGWLRFSIVLPMIVLMVAASVQATNPFKETVHTRPPHLAQTVPAGPEGWTSRNLPIGANEFLSGEAEKILNYDEYLNREYTKGGRTFGVYIAYWGAGKMPVRMVAMHTPDRCWTGNGWHCLEQKYRQPENCNGVAYKPAEWRLFQPPEGGKPMYVLYWHLVDGRLYDYGRRFNDIPDPILYWEDVFHQMVLGNREQYFIRLTSSEPLDNLRDDPGFDAVVKSLAGLGLALSGPESAGG